MGCLAPQLSLIHAVWRQLAAVVSVLQLCLLELAWCVVLPAPYYVGMQGDLAFGCCVVVLAFDSQSDGSRSTERRASFGCLLLVCC
jgi:hypothetical protein